MKREWGSSCHEIYTNNNEVLMINIDIHLELPH